MVETGGSGRSEDAAPPLGDESGAGGRQRMSSGFLAHPTGYSHRRGMHTVYRYREGQHFMAAAAAESANDCP